MSEENNKKDNGIVNGIILITIGVIALLVTFFDFEIVWSEFAKLWPVFIIIFGISLLPLNKILKSVLVMIMILFSCYLYYDSVNEDDSRDDDFYYDYSDNGDVQIQEFSESFKENTEEVKVLINYGAGLLFLNPPVDELVKASNHSNHIVQDFSVKYEENRADIVFDVEDNITVSGKDVNSNRFELALNEKPIYDFEINFGASDMKFDLSDYKVSDVEVNGGACDINMKFGDLQEYAELKINTGVSDVKIGLPINSGCRIECESVLSNKDFKDFIKKSGNVYETSNYSSAQKIIKIEFSGAISDVEIYRY